MPDTPTTTQPDITQLLNTTDQAGQVPNIQNNIIPTELPATAPVPKVNTTIPAVVPVDTNAAELNTLKSQLANRAAEVSQLRAVLDQIISNPDLAEALEKQNKPKTSDPTDVIKGIPASVIKQQLAAYKQAGTDEEAFAAMLAAAKELSVSELEQKLQQRDEEARANAQKQQVYNAINNRLAKEAPDIPAEYFWALIPQIHAATPTDIYDTEQRLEWQYQQAIKLARQRQLPFMVQLAARLANNTKAKQALSALVVPGSVSSTMNMGSNASNQDQPKTMVEQMKTLQSKRFGR